MTIKIDLYGDSTQVGQELINGVYVTTARPPAEILQQSMDARFGAGAVLVRNKAIGGTMIYEQWWGYAPYSQAWEAEMAASDADIVVDNHGINDSFVPWEQVTDFIWCVNQMAASAVACGKLYFQETPNPTFGENSVANAKIQAFINAIYTNASNTNMSIVYINNMIVANINYWKPHLTGNMIHPDAELYEYIGNHLFYTLEPVVKGMV